MQKKIITIVVLVLIILVSFKTSNVFADSTSVSMRKPFGGKIINAKATQIQTLEDSDYNCVVPGSSITIRPIGKYPASYLIPAAIKSKTNTTPRSGQWILGLYSQTTTPITCIMKTYPWTSTTVNLNSITLFGTSK